MTTGTHKIQAWRLTPLRRPQATHFKNGEIHAVSSNTLIPTVRATRCPFDADDETVYRALVRATEPLTATWERLQRAQRIGIKFNQDKPPTRQVRYQGQLQQLVSTRVARAVLRLLRERTSAELVCVDVSYYALYEGTRPLETATVLPVLREYGVEYADGTQPPYSICAVPDGGRMFRRYMLPQPAVDTDEFVSVAKLKNHAFMGVTLTLKNLFGLMPGPPHNHGRHYYHHLVRMPYMLADLGRILDPALNVIDGLVGQAGQEWGDGKEQGPPRVANALIAGDHTIATDACAARLMGHDPQSDWLIPPFHRDRNALRVAAEGGFGTVDPGQMDYASELDGPLGEFFVRETDSREMVRSWRRTTCEQALHYRDHQDTFTRRYAGEYILLQEGQVRWHSPDSALRRSRRQLAGSRPEQAMWLKYVDPDEVEGEHYEVYPAALQAMPAV